MGAEYVLAFPCKWSRQYYWLDWVCEQFPNLSFLIIRLPRHDAMRHELSCQEVSTNQHYVLVGEDNEASRRWRDWVIWAFPLWSEWLGSRWTVHSRVWLHMLEQSRPITNESQSPDPSELATYGAALVWRLLIPPLIKHRAGRGSKTCRTKKDKLDYKAYATWRRSVMTGPSAKSEEWRVASWKVKISSQPMLRHHWIWNYSRLDGPVPVKIIQA